MEPLNDEELAMFEAKYVSLYKKIETMDAKTAAKLFKVVSQDVSDIDSERFYHNLFIRRLHMIIDSKNYPERLI